MTHCQKCGLFSDNTVCEFCEDEQLPRDQRQFRPYKFPVLEAVATDAHITPIKNDRRWLVRGGFNT